MTATMGIKLDFSPFKYLNILCFIFSKDFSQLPENIKDYISILQNDNDRYLIETQSLKTQLNNLTTVVDFADSTRIAEISDLKQRHQQELDTINILMEGILNFIFDRNTFLLFY
jgi:hypothetical protein